MNNNIDDDVVKFHVAKDAEPLTGYKPYVSPHPANTDDNIYAGIAKASTTGNPTKARKGNKAVKVLVVLGITATFAGGIASTDVAKEMGASAARPLDNAVINALADQVSERYGVSYHHTQDKIHHYYDSASTVSEVDQVITPTTLYLRKLADGDTDGCLNALDAAVTNGTFVGDPEETAKGLGANWNQTRHSLAKTSRDLEKKLGRTPTVEDLLANALDEALRSQYVQVAHGIYLSHQDYCDQLLGRLIPDENTNSRGSR